MKDLIFKWALQNAVKYRGKANSGAIVGKILSEKPELKDEIKHLMKDIKETVVKVNSLNPEEQEYELKKFGNFEIKQEYKHGLKELEGAEHGKVVMRFEPSPSGPLHIGHAYVGGLNHLYVKKYKGTFILRISDTNQDNIYVPAYEMIIEDGKWLWGKDIKVVIQSDNIEMYYEYAVKLLEQGDCYVCTCSPETFKKYIDNQKDCKCRGLNVSENLKRWRLMLTKWKEGDGVIRFKSDMQHKNPAMRDFPLLRINLTKHPRQGNKYRVWPLMNFSVAIDDLEVTHRISGKDHEDNAKKQELIHKALGKKSPHNWFGGRINFVGLELSCTKIKEKIKNKEYTGWDDPRLPFIPALRKRGYKPETFNNYAFEVGLSLNDKTVTAEDFFKNINHLNRKEVECKNRYFFVENPKKIKIKNAPSMNIKVELHPDEPKRGYRYFKTSDEFYISDELKKNEDYRLMHLFNFKNKEFAGKELDKDANMIHWLPVSDDLVKVEVVMPDNTKTKGFAEKTIKELKEGDICQFERYGFVRLDKKIKDKFIFYFGHK